MEPVLLAGATGTLGRRLIPALGDAGYRVVALARPASRSKLDPFAHALAGVRIAEVIDADSLRGACEGIGLVVSAVGITRQRDGLTHDRVDYRGNLNLLREAERAAVRHFTYVSVVGAERLVGVPVLNAKYRFEQALTVARLRWTVIRPSGFYTDLLDVLAMARRGVVFQFGDGECRTTPIDVDDLARFVAANAERENAVLGAGGPADFTWNQIAAECFAALGRSGRVFHLPTWSLRALKAGSRAVSTQLHGVLSFVGYVQTHDTTASKVGTRPLRDFLAEHGGTRPMTP